MRRRIRALLATGISGIVTLPNCLPAATLYWDANGTTAGAGVAPVGTWGISPFWNTESDGTDGGGFGVIGTWTDGNTAVFSAGTDATGVFTVSVSGVQSIVGGLQIDEGSPTFTSGSLDMTATGASATIASVLTGGRLTHSGAGALTIGTVLNQPNTFTGGVTLSGGLTLFQGENSALAGNANALGAAPASFVANYLQLGNGATLRSLRSSTTAAFVLPNRGVELFAGGGAFDVNVSTAILTYAGVISGTGAFTKLGKGTLRLANTNTYSGDTNVSLGTLTARTGAAIPDNSNVVIASTASSDPTFLEIDAGVGVTETVATVSGGGASNSFSGAIKLTTGTLAVGSSNADFTYSGAITGSGSLQKIGTGVWTIENWNFENTGATTISAGAIKLGGGASGLGDLSPVSIASGATLDLNGAGDAVGSLAGAGNLINAAQTVEVAGVNDSPVTFSGDITGGAGFAKSGPGVQALTGANDLGIVHVGDGELEVTASGLGTSNVNDIEIVNGTLRALSTINSPARTLYVDGFATLDTNANDVTLGDAIGGQTLVKQNAGTLTVNRLDLASVYVTGGKLAIAPDGSASGVSVVGNTVVVDAQLDLQNNRLIDHYTGVGTFDGVAYNGITGLLAAGYTGGLWTGNGIVTSQSNATSGSNYHTLGVATAADVCGIALTDTALWSGQTVAGSDTLVMYTYGGDANLDGKVDIDDYGIIDYNASTGGSLGGYYNGDFDYDGFLTIDDYGIIDFVVNIQGPPFATATGTSITSVPESSAACGLAVFLGALASRRRRL